MTNKNKPPTKTDREILAFLQGGGSVNFLTAFQTFKTSRLSDNIYRLRQAGNIILDEVVYYKKNKITKHYYNFCMIKPKIKKAGTKTGKEKIEL